MKRERMKDCSGELTSKPKKPHTAPSDLLLLSSSVPEHMVTEILVKLPAKSLLRFRCLSRHHSNLIQSPSFIAAHASHAYRNSAGLLVLATSQSSDNDVVSFLPSKLEGLGRKSSGCQTGGGAVHGLLSAFPLTFLKKNKEEGYRVGKNTSFECVGSLNGLVCFILDPRRYWVLWNPATSQFCFTLGLLKPRKNMIVGFGYDSVANDYKSVRVSCCKNGGGGGAKVEVLSWAKRYWTEIQDKSFRAIFSTENWQHLQFHHPPVTTNNGRVNWMETSSGMVLSFKLHDGKFEWISTPEAASLLWDSFERTICAWKGSLAMLVQPVVGQDSLLSLWLFNDGGGGGESSSSWSKLFTIFTEGPHCMPEAIWSLNDGQSSFLVYLNCIACNYSNGQRLKLPYESIDRAFEFAPTLVPIPGCS